MKRLAPLCLFTALLCVSLTPIFATTTVSPESMPKASDNSPASAISSTITTVTGLAISPLMGTGALGAYKYATASAEVRAGLPWYARPSFFIPALLVVLLCAFKDSLGAVLPPGWKKPMDILETVENKLSGLVAAGAVVPFAVDSLRGLISSSASAAGIHEGAQQTTGLAMLHFASMDFSWLLNILTIPLGIAMFAVVWMASHAINVLILLSPWGAIDAGLKAARTSLLGLLTLTAALDPKIAAALSILLIIIAYFVAGWAFRLTIFGTSFCWDFFTLRKHRFKVDARSNKLFSGAQLKGTPLRTFGALLNEPENGRMQFIFRPWLIGPPRTVEVVLTKPFIGKGLFFSTVRDGEHTCFLLPPRYRGHEEEFARTYALEGGVHDAGLLKAWSSMRELFGGSATKTQVI